MNMNLESRDSLDFEKMVELYKGQSFTKHNLILNTLAYAVLSLISVVI